MKAPWHVRLLRRVTGWAAARTPAQRQRLAALLAALAGAVLLALGAYAPWSGLPIRAARKLIPQYTMIRQTVKIYCLLPALLAPLLALAVWWVIRRSLTPVHRVRRELALRQPQDLAPVAEHDLPDEMRPLVEELNNLLQRVRQAFEAQQNFVADAAHELRSPLAALQLQLQLLRKATDSAERESAQTSLAQGIERARRLVEQLLALARQEARPQTEDAPLADLRVLVEQALADAAPAAQAKGLDMGLSEDPQQQSAFSVAADAGALAVLLRNLLDNAIKYVPAGSRVDMGWLQDEHGRALVVEDSGPGIAPAERQRVLQRFVRGQGAGGMAGGSGLGLAIAQSIAQSSGAELLLDESPQLGGLRVRVLWPQS